MNHIIMKEKQINLGDLIYIGNRKAVISNIYDNDLTKIEVVYIDDRNRAINKDAHLVEGIWEFDGSLGGGYADKYDRLQEYISILKRK